MKSETPYGEENSSEQSTSTVEGEPAEAEATSEPAPAAAAAPPTRAARHDGPPPKKLLRTLYWVTWFLVVPLIASCALVWALTPPSGVEREGFLGSLEALVREQPVPIGIVTFTIFEMALYWMRHLLPFAYHAYPPLRADLPRGMRAPFERARALIDESEAILEKNTAAVKRDMSAKERAKLQGDLDALEAAMAAPTFDEEGFVDALVRADQEVELRLGRWRKSELREYSESILIAVIVAMGLRTFVIEAFKIPSRSMVPTLQVGDHIFVNKFAYGASIPWSHTRIASNMPPKRGDVIVFSYPEHPEQDFIKRVIAIPGDRLEARGGHPILNGWTVPSCYAGKYGYVEDGMKHEGELYVEYLGDEAFLTFYDGQGLASDYQGPFYVKPGEAYVMGDNRNNSHDSRLWWGGVGGGVPFDNIKGRALFIWLSYADSMDWSRMFAPVMGRPPGHGPIPEMPAAIKDLVPAIDKCLKDRPPLDQTRPPPPGERKAASKPAPTAPGEGATP